MGVDVLERSCRAVLLGLLLASLACAGGSSPVTETLPASSAFAELEVGMSGLAVRERLGAPQKMRRYQTWRAWVPFYFGQHTSRTDWTYPGEGRLVFSRNRYSGNLTLLEIVYEPAEES